MVIQADNNDEEDEDDQGEGEAEDPSYVLRLQEPKQLLKTVNKFEYFSQPPIKDDSSPVDSKI